MIAPTALNTVFAPTLAAGAVSGILSALGAAKGLIVTLVIGMIVLAILIIGFRWLMKHREKIKGRAFVGQMLGMLGRTPQAVADPAARAELEDMRKKFDDGVEKYRAVGKDLYKLPWYLLVGPPGSGKTEMMRHCNIGFPPGLHDYLQGVGGTLNMNWWFANQGIVLDTAGKMLMKEVGAGESSLWKDLLGMLKRVRAMQPINGMILCIGVDSLIKDSADQIEQKAGTIARQLDVIQRTLDIRFPVYIVVTKCDLITGFREFFERVTDPALQHQMVGWSNPAELDTPFNPESVDQHIEQVRQRLIRRRFSLVVDPVHTEDPQARRTDQVDALFALPESLSRLSSRLRRYLELIFVAGEWSPKPLFLRGIYFTSSMRQGAELDEEVAKIMGIGVDALPGGGMAEERSYFIRDTLLQKVFKERGLVTRATNVDQQQRKRKLIGVGTGIGVLAALLAIAATTLTSFYKSIGKPKDEWAAIAREFAMKGNDTVDISTGKPTFDPTPVIKIGAEEVSRVELLGRSLELAKTPISAPLVIRPLVSAQNLVTESVPEQARQAHAVVLARVGLANMVQQAREKMGTVKPAEWNEDATGVLAGLLNIQRGITPKARVVERSDDRTAAARAAALNAPPEFKQPLHVARFLSFVLSPEEFAKAKPQIEEFQGVVEETYGPEMKSPWPPGAIAVLSPDAVAKGVATFNDYWLNVAPSRSFGEIDKLRKMTGEFAAREQNLAAAVAKLRAGSLTPEKYAEFKDSWTKGVKSLSDFDAKIKEILSNNKEGLSKIGDTLDAASVRIKNRAEEEYRVVLGEDPPGLLDKLEGAVEKAAEKKLDKATDALDRKADQLTGSKAGLDLKLGAAEWKKDLEPLRQDLIAARKKVTGSSIDETVASLKTYFAPTGEGGRLLAPTSGNNAGAVFAARYLAYKAVADAIAANSDEGVAWGQARATSESVNASMSKAVDALRATLVGVPADPASGGVAGKDLESLLTDAAARARRTEIVKTLAAKGLEGNADSVGKLVAGSGAAEAQSFSIPMVSSGGGVLSIDRRYDPDAAARIISDLAFVAALNPAKPGAADSPVLDDPDVRSAATTARQAMDAYAIKFTAYWTTELADALKINAPAEWSQFGPAMVAPSDSSRLGDDLVKLSRLVERALGLVPDMSAQPPSADVAVWRAAAKSDGEKSNPGVLVSRALDNWRSLPSEGRKARLLLGNLTRDEFAGNYLQGYVSDFEAGKPTGPLTRYLDQVRLAALDLLSRESTRQWADLRERLGRGGGIPLSMSRSDWPRTAKPAVVSIADVRLVNDLMPYVARTGDATRLRGGVQTTLRDIDQRLGTLFGGETVKGRELLLKSLGVWLPFVLGEGEKLTCEVVVPDVAEQKKPAKTLDAKGLKNMFGVQNVTAASVDGGKSVSANDQTEVGASLAAGIAVPGQAGLKLSSLKLVGDVQAQGSREIGTEWFVLELLAEPDAHVVEGGDGKRWLVPVVYFGEGGQVFYKWVELKFSAIVPARKDWPTQQLWQ